MKSRTWMWKSIFSAAALLVLASTVYAAPITVNCGKGGSINATLASLANAGNTRGVTIFVTGICRENVSIAGFDHLTLQARPVAGIQDASNGNAPVVSIHASYDVTLQGFTVKGGSDGIVCDQVSYCTLYLNIIQQSGWDGVNFYHSHGIVIRNNISSNAQTGVDVLNGSTVDAISNTVNNNGQYGIAASNGSAVDTVSDTISGNGAAGIVVLPGSSLVAQQDTVQNNSGQGIWVLKAAAIRVFDLTITGNGLAGIDLSQHSSAAIEQLSNGNVITGNSGNGVRIGDLSFAEFDGANNVSGNLTQPDVACRPQFSATRGAGTVGGTTNCMEPQDSKQQHPLPQAEGNGLPERR